MQAKAFIFLALLCTAWTVPARELKGVHGEARRAWMLG